MWSLLEAKHKTSDIVPIGENRIFKQLQNFEHQFGTRIMTKRLIKCVALDKKLRSAISEEEVELIKEHFNNKDCLHMVEKQ